MLHNQNMAEIINHRTVLDEISRITGLALAMKTYMVVCSIFHNFNRDSSRVITLQ